MVACRSVGAAKAVGTARRRRQHEQCDAAGAQHRWRQREEALGGKRRSALPRHLRSTGWHCCGRGLEAVADVCSLRTDLNEKLGAFTLLDKGVLMLLVPAHRQR